MNRRYALLSIGTAVTVGLTGCLGSTQSSPNESTPAASGDTVTAKPSTGAPTTETTTASDTAADSSSTATAVALPDPPFEGMQEEPTETYVVGAQGGTAKTTKTPQPTSTPKTAKATKTANQSPGAHVVQIWNDGEVSRELTVTITGEKTGTQFDETVDVPAGEHLNFVFRTPDAYTVEVSGDGFSKTTSVDRDWNECSTSMATIRLTENGSEMRSVSESRTC